MPKCSSFHGISGKFSLGNLLWAKHDHLEKYDSEHNTIYTF